MRSFDPQSCGLCGHFKQQIPELSVSPEADMLTIMVIVNRGTCTIDEEEVGYSDHGCASHTPVFEILHA